MHEGYNELYLVHADGTGLTRLTLSVEDKSAPAWSVDGQWIAFGAISHEGHQSNLYKIRPDGSQLTRLTDTPTRDSFPAWSSDGQWIAFSSSNDEPYSKNPSPRKFYQIPADGGERTPLDTSNPATVAQFLLASANGQFLLDWALLTRPEGGWNDLVHQMDETLQIPQIAWAPDMRQVAYTTYRDGNAEIYVINTDGSGRRRLTNDPAKEEFPVWSPDGQRISFLSSVQGQGESIDLINADGSGRTRLVEAAQAQKLAWSPDGQFLAYNADGPIIVIRADGSQVARIPVVATGFAWAPR